MRPKLAIQLLLFCSSGLLAARVGAGDSPIPDLGFHFANVARQSGLTGMTIYGDEHRNRYLLETTGCGAGFIDYDNDGWEDVILVNGTRLDPMTSGEAPTTRLYHNNRDGTFTDVTAK